MISPTLLLTADELAAALDGVDPVTALVGQPVGWIRLTHWQGPSSDTVLLEDRRSGARCVLPASSLRAGRAAALSGLAARKLAAPGLGVAAVLGFGLAAQVHLRMIIRHLSAVSKINVCDGPIESTVLDRIDLAGIQLAVAADPGDVVLGANQVLVVSSAPGRLEVGRLTRGALVVNAANEDLPDDLIDAVDQVYVDDAALIAEHPDRYFVRAHRGIDADLGQVLAGVHPGRTHLDQIVLVELLSANALAKSFACLVYQAALDRGLGSQLCE